MDTYGINFKNIRNTFGFGKAHIDPMEVEEKGETKKI
jgi:tetratricopeptide (TPR) repeat protein